MRIFSQKSGFIFQALKLETFFSGLTGASAFLLVLIGCHRGRRQPASARDGAHADEALDGPQLVHGGSVHGGVHVDDGVGHVPTALACHGGDVQGGFGQDGGNLAHHVGDVLVGDAQPCSASGDGPVKPALGEVHGVDDGASLQEVPQLLHGHQGTVLLSLRGGGSQVGQADDLVVAQKLLVGKVGDKAVNLAGLDALQQVGVHHQAATGQVDDAHALLHGLDFVCIDEALGFGGLGHVDGDVVGLGEDGVQCLGLHHRAAQGPGGIHGDEGVVADDLHAQVGGTVGHHGTDGPQTDDS